MEPEQVSFIDTSNFMLILCFFKRKNNFKQKKEDLIKFRLNILRWNARRMGYRVTKHSCRSESNKLSYVTCNLRIVRTQIGQILLWRRRMNGWMAARLQAPFHAGKIWFEWKSERHSDFKRVMMNFPQTIWTRMRCNFVATWNFQRTFTFTFIFAGKI